MSTNINITDNSSARAVRVPLRPSVRSRYCSRCKLVVADLADMSNEEIADYFVSHYNDRVCVSYTNCFTRKKGLSARLIGWCRSKFSKKEKKQFYCF